MKKPIHMGEMEERFAEIVWKQEPVSTKDLIRLCEEEFQWDRTTMYTVLRRLIRKGIFRNDKKIVTSVVSREEFNAIQSAQFVDDTFKGSLPAFLSAFTSRRNLSEAEIAEIRALIDEEARKEEGR